MISPNAKQAIRQAEEDLAAAKEAILSTHRIDIREITNLCLVAQASAIVAQCLVQEGTS